MISKLQHHKNQQWIIISKRGRMSPLPNVYSMEAVTTLTPQFLDGLTYKKMLLTFQKREMYCTVDKESHDAIEKAGIAPLRKNPKLFTERIAEIQVKAKEVIEWLKTIHKTNLSIVSEQELINIYERYRAAYKEIYGRYFTILILERALTTHLQNILINKGSEKDAATAFTLLTSELGAMHTKNEERDRLELSMEIAKDSKLLELFKKDGEALEQELSQYPETEKLINNHTEKYFWITRDYEDPILTKKDFLTKIKESLQDKNLQLQTEETKNEEKYLKQKREKLEKDLQLTEQESNDFALMREGIYLKELRKSIVSQSLYYFDNVLEEMRKRTNISLPLLRMMLPEDLTPIFVEKKSYHKTLEERYEKSVYVMEEGKHTLYEGKEAEELFNTVVAVNQNVTSLKGISASAGVAQGPARIIKHPSDFDKIKEGDIMITVQAVPSFLETLKKCKGLVADGGTGITSHPATLAREVGIPCVVQTKTATEIIHDGDSIEVDGNKGIVKILKKREK